MRAKGIGYDTGFRIGGSAGRPVGPAVMRRELEDGHGQTYPDMQWEPKAAFAAVAEEYSRG